MSLKIPVTPPGIDPGTIRLVAQRLNHYATPGPLYIYIYIYIYIYMSVLGIPYKIAMLYFLFIFFNIVY